MGIVQGRASGPVLGLKRNQHVGRRTGEQVYVLSHKLMSIVFFTLLYGLDDAIVFGRRTLHAPRLESDMTPIGIQALFELFAFIEQKPALRALIDEGVEVDVGGIKAIGIVGFGPFVAQIVEFAQGLEFVAAQATGAKPRRQTIEFCENLEHLDEFSSRQGPYSGPLIVPNLYKSTGSKVTQCFAHRRARDFKPPGQRLLVQPVTGFELTVQDVVFEYPDQVCRRCAQPKFTAHRTQPPSFDPAIDPETR